MCRKLIPSISIFLEKWNKIKDWKEKRAPSKPENSSNWRRREWQPMGAADWWTSRLEAETSTLSTKQSTDKLPCFPKGDWQFMSFSPVSHVEDLMCDSVTINNVTKCTSAALGDDVSSWPGRSRPLEVVGSNHGAWKMKRKHLMLLQDLPSQRFQERQIYFSPLDPTKESTADYLRSDATWLENFMVLWVVAWRQAGSHSTSTGHFQRFQVHFYEHQNSSESSSNHFPQHLRRMLHPLLSFSLLCLLLVISFLKLYQLWFRVNYFKSLIITWEFRTWGRNYEDNFINHEMLNSF